MPKIRRSENKGLPERWRIKHGAYFYRVPPGLEKLWDNKKEFRLGSSLVEAYREWSRRLGETDRKETLSQLFDRYLLEVTPTKAAASQTQDALQAVALRKVFGSTRINDLTPQDVYRYVDQRSKKSVNENGKTVGGPTVARQEKAFLSAACTKAVKWGYVENHPFKGEVVLEGETPRDRYVEDWEIVEFLSLGSRRKKGSVKVIHAYTKLKLLTGMAKSDLLRIEMGHLKDDGIHNQRHKTKKSTGKRTIYEWTDALREAVDEAKASRPVLSSFLFCTKRGRGYFDEKTGKASGWDSMWQRYMDRVLHETKVTERFTEHDLRAKCASDAKSAEHASKLLAHADIKTTNRIYRRKPERVQPLK